MGKDTTVAVVDAAVVAAAPPTKATILTHVLIWCFKIVESYTRKEKNLIEWQPLLITNL